MQRTIHGRDVGKEVRVRFRMGDKRKGHKVVRLCNGGRVGERQR